MTPLSLARDLPRAIFASDQLWAACVRWLVVVLAATLLVWWLEPALHDGFNIGLLWRNALPVSLFALLLYAISGRVLLSIVLTGTVTWLIFAVNAIKEQRMNAPLMPGDLVLEGQLQHHLMFFARYTGGGVILWCGFLAFLAMGWGLWRWERRWPRPKWGTRLILILLSLAMLYTVFRGERPWGMAYSDAELTGYEAWEPVVSVRHTGLMAGLVRMIQDARIRIPKADHEAVTAFAKDHQATLIARAARQPPAQLPDIVVVQSEAFFDPGILKGIEPGEFAPNFDRLAQGGITGSLGTPAYGGGTIRTEFETLTGYPMQAFPAVAYPYYGLASEWMPSVPHRLQAFGYSTTLFHPFQGDFWNRQEVMPKLGFEQSHYEKDFAGAARAGVYVSDQALFNFVLAHLDHETDNPSYSLLITMENHGPWSNDPVGVEHALDNHPLPAGLSADGRRQLIYYASHLVNGDAALGDFSQRLLARPRWTILLFYGDHLPSLNSAFADLGFDDGKTYADEHTHYMLISNRPLKPRKLNLNAYELPGLLFDSIGLPEDGYLAFDGVLRQVEAKALPQEVPGYDQMFFNAARIEVRCKRKLSLSGKCIKHIL